MNVRTALLYRKNLATLVDESVGAGHIDVFLYIKTDYFGSVRRILLLCLQVYPHT
jgi:hypothetical protein